MLLRLALSGGFVSKLYLHFDKDNFTYVNGCVVSLERNSDVYGMWISNGIQMGSYELNVTDLDQSKSINNTEFMYGLPGYRITTVSELGTFTCTISSSILPEPLKSEGLRVNSK